MNEAHDPLEAELAALRPHDASPELRQRIAKHRAIFMPQERDGGGDSPSPAAWPPLAWRRRSFSDWGGDRRVEPEPIAVLPQPAPPVEVEDSGPTLLAYQRALARSPEDLDALLDKDAMAAQESNPELVRICAFTRSDADITRLTRRKLMRCWNLVSVLPARWPYSRPARRRRRLRTPNQTSGPTRR